MGACLEKAAFDINTKTEGTFRTGKWNFRVASPFVLPLSSHIYKALHAKASSPFCAQLMMLPSVDD